MTSHIDVATSLFFDTMLKLAFTSRAAILYFHIDSYWSVPQHILSSYMDDRLISPWRSSYIQYQSQVMK